eukprot:m.68246 g.68246  ORF g.68246 m.68246 type:complete len:359 (+) comp35502_c0_seq3:90-1166(+)
MSTDSSSSETPSLSLASGLTASTVLVGERREVVLVTRVDELTYQTRYEIAKLMNLENPMGTDWRMFADLVDITKIDIDTIARERDPMNTVLTSWISTKLPTIEDLMDVLRKLRRRDVMEIVEKAPGVSRCEVRGGLDFPDGGVSPLKGDRTLLADLRLDDVQSPDSPKPSLESSQSSLTSPQPSVSYKDKEVVVDDYDADSPESIQLLLSKCIRNYKKPETEGEKFFDVFISFHEKDDSFAMELIEKCKESNLSVFTGAHDENLMGGVDMFEHVEEIIEHACKRTAIILSPDYVNSEMKSFEANIAFRLSPALRRRFFIPVIYRTCRIPKLFRYITYIDFTNELHRPNFWPKLIDSLK